MIFEKISFIKPDRPFERGFSKSNYAPLFRKKIWIESQGNAKLYVCGLGIGYYYINGQPVSEDLFTAPFSDYNKTLWYNVYDVSDLMRKGENVIAVVCGNGWYNEDCSSAWDFDKAPWRDLPKFILRLDVEDRIAAISDDTWKCKPDSATWFNALRNGEYFDANKYEEDWMNLEFDDTLWENAVIDKNPPTGLFRECKCEPIREEKIFTPQQIRKTGKKKYVFDFGQNISGYIRICVAGRKNELLQIRYAEQLRDDGTRELNGMETFYTESEFQTDKFICSGKKMTWSPRFTYHGFRYAEIEGIENLDLIEVSAVFVHQAIEAKTQFKCSDAFWNELFRAGQISTLSNMFYMLTDCPTREKLGWANDAQASAEQVLTNFKAEKLLEKWLTDIKDAMRTDGCMPGIIPTAGWGYEWGNGPVSDGVLFEIPYRIYLHTGDRKPLVESIPWFDRYFSYLKQNTDEDGFIRFGLFDWAGPDFLAERDNPSVPVELINGALVYRFYQIAELAARLEQDISFDSTNMAYDHDAAYYQENAFRIKKNLIEKYIGKDGRCVIHKQTAVALLIYYNLYENLEPIKIQLKNLIEEHQYRHDCGMVGLRRLFHALNKCGLEEYAYKVVTADGMPGFRTWFEQGATTLWEYWNEYEGVSGSRNHHMYSDVMSWMIKTILGIKIDEKAPGYEAINLQPYFFRELEYAEGACDTPKGQLYIAWKKDKNVAVVTIDVPENLNVYYFSKKLHTGRNVEITELGRKL